MGSLGITPTLLYSILLLSMCTMSESAPRLCGADFKTPGRCFIFEDTPKSWQVAENHCRQKLPFPGHLGFVKDQETQSLLETEVQKKGWSNTWISGKVSDRRWSWFTSWKWLAFQGCWRDQTSNRDLPAEVPGITTPALCIEACTGMEYDYAGVQLEPSGGLLCHCGHRFGKHGRAYNEGCDNSCPRQTSDSKSINTKCGGPDLQLVFYTGIGATLFHHFAPSKLRRFENCVVYDHTLNHQWTEQNCQMKQGFICAYIHEESGCLWKNLTWADGTCVSIHNIKMDYYEAYAYCREHAVILATIKNAAVNSAILRNLAPNVSYYTLLNAQVITTSFYAFIKGYVNFADFQPSTEKDQDCFVMRSAESYEWSTVNCDIQYPFICMLDIESGSTSPLPNIDITSTQGSTQTTSSKQGNSTGECVGNCSRTALYIGIGVGLAALTLIVLIILVFCFTKRRTQSRKSNQTSRRRSATNPGIPLHKNKHRDSHLTGAPSQEIPHNKNLNEPLPHPPITNTENRYLSVKGQKTNPYDNDQRRLEKEGEHVYEEPDYYVEITQ